MRALAVRSGTPGVLVVERPEPAVTHPDGVKVRVLAVGICGTDREEVAGGRAKAPEGQAQLVIGHEMLGQVVEVGPAVRELKVGDLAVFTVRRGCGEDISCLVGRPDMCRTGRYLERGIWGLDGFQTEYVVDGEAYAVRVPAGLGELGALVEPLSVAEKAIDEAVRVQPARLPEAGVTPTWLAGRRCLVVGLGPIGLLGALALSLRGAEVYGLDVVDPGTPRAAWLSALGGSYVDGRQVPPDRFPEAVGTFDLIFEAAGVAALDFNLLEALAPGGVLVLTGIPGEERPFQVPGGVLARRLVLGNLLVVGSVNAARDHYRLAVEDLVRAVCRWGQEFVGRLITHRYSVEAAPEAFSRHPPDEVKAVVDWAG
jgi:threonine dehydrogenase-like Zn-dependent dehydrogenase